MVRPAGIRVRTYLFSLLVTLCAVTVLGGSASAAPWEKLPDGRLIIPIKGLQFAFPSAGGDLDYVWFSDWSVRHQFMLRRAIEEPKFAQEILAEDENFMVRLSNNVDAKDLFLGRFDRSQFPTLVLGFGIGDKAQGGCDDWERLYSELKNGLALGDSRVGPDGWAEFQEGERPPSFLYVRPALGVDPSNFVAGIQCNAFDVCGSIKCMSTNLSFSFQFNRKVIAQKDWRSFISKLDDVLRFVLTNGAK